VDIVPSGTTMQGSGIADMDIRVRTRMTASPPFNPPLQDISFIPIRIVDQPDAR